MSNATLALRGATTATIHHLASKRMVGAVLFALLAYWLWQASANEPFALRSSVLIMLGAIALWAMRHVDELWVGLCACLALLATGSAAPSALQTALGSDLIWLMLGAFMLAGALQRSGTAQAACLRLLGRRPRFGTLVIRLQLAVAASAFLIPSTSARAALFLPVFIAFLPALKPLGQRAIRIVALLIPTQILLTAGISITGAGAHLVAAQFMQTHAGYKVDALSWTLLALPVVAMTSLSASVVVLIAFRGLALWNLPIGAPQSDAQQPAPLTLPQKRVGLIALGVAAGWMLSPALDVPAWAIGLLGAVLAGTPRISGLDLDDLVRSVDWSLILFFAATVMIGETLGASGAAQWIARHTAALGAIDQLGTVGLLALVTMVSLLAHLWIPSRTARVIVLLPSTVLPLASGHHDLAVLTLVCVQASGFCQTFSASAKPMAVFCRQTLEGAAVISSHDLLRAAWPIGLAMAVAVMLSALFWWPRMVGISF